MAKQRARVVSKTASRRQAAHDFSIKKAKQKRLVMRKRAALLSVAALLLTTTVGAWWLHRSGTLDAAVNQVSYYAWKLTADAGFRVDQVYLRGRHFSDKAEIAKAINITQGQALLALPLQEIQSRLEAIPEVQHARVQRMLPSRVRIEITERVPAVLWQRQGQHVLMDKQGVALDSAKYNIRHRLPVVVGTDAPKHVKALLAMLHQTPDLQGQVVAAIRVGERRWNIQLANQMTIMLPEQDASRAWMRFAQMVKEEGLLTRAIARIDMRVEDRIFVTPTSQPMVPVALSKARDA